jgi:hypothetical protein
VITHNAKAPVNTTGALFVRVKPAFAIRQGVKLPISREPSVRSDAGVAAQSPVLIRNNRVHSGGAVIHGICELTPTFPISGVGDCHLVTGVLFTEQRLLTIVIVQFRLFCISFHHFLPPALRAFIRPGRFPGDASRERRFAC